jgi:drug/metabolite transporter (DMT)-like permease
MTNISLVLLMGILSTLQTHLAKALERQGIEIFDRIQTRRKKGAPGQQGDVRKPLIYSLGLFLNFTVFIWAVLAQPFGPPALFTSMFGVGLAFLMVYARIVLKERISRLDAAGAAAIISGTLVVGIENIFRTDANRFNMDLNGMFLALLIWLTAGSAFILIAHRRRSPSLIATAYGMLAGGLGGLDPFLKGVGQGYGGDPLIIPGSLTGMILFLASFVIGFLAFLVTQFGFVQKAPASRLVPAYNATYIGLPVVLQAFLLPGYPLYWTTITGVGLIMAGVLVMGAFDHR